MNPGYLTTTREHATASGLQFAHVHDGPPLPDRVVGCLERALGTYEALAEAHPFPVFTGDIPIRLSWYLTPPESALPAPMRPLLTWGDGEV